MMFRVTIPGVGQVFVQARDQNEAIAAAQRYVNQNGIRLEEGAGNFTATGFAAGSIPGGATVIGLDGKRVAPASSDLDTPNTAPGRPASGGTGTGGAATGGGNPLIPGVGGQLPPSGNPGSPTSPANPVIETQPIPQGKGTIDEATLEGSLPGSAFNRFLRSVNVRPEGIGGQLAQSQLSPAHTAFKFANDLGLINTGGDSPFNQFLQQGPLGQRFANLGHQAFNAAQRSGNLEEPQFFDSDGGFQFTQGARSLIDLARLASRAGRSPISSGLFTPSDQTLIQRFQDSLFNSGGTSNVPFIDFLKDQFRIQSAGATRAF